MLDSQTIRAWQEAPRLTSFASFFEQTARGTANLPDLGQPEPDMRLLAFDLDCLAFWDTHRRLWGNFDYHYFASIPYRLEEEMRLGTAILAFGLQAWGREQRAATVYTLGAGAGTLARTLARIGDGRFKTLCCSPTDGNKASFFARRGSQHAHFHHGPFFELDEARYASDANLAPFRDGYDVLLEDTTFQMYGRNRDDQLAVIAPRVRPEGLLIQVQKLSQPDIDIYYGREDQKDGQFKSRYFSTAQIAAKKHDVLDVMTTFQVDLKTSLTALASHFGYSAVTWNSGNFYTIISANSLTVLQSFVSSMLKPAIPSDYCYETLPQIHARREILPVTTDWPGGFPTWSWPQNRPSRRAEGSLSNRQDQETGICRSMKRIWTGTATPAQT